MPLSGRALRATDEAMSLPSFVISSACTEADLEAGHSVRNIVETSRLACAQRQDVEHCTAVRLRAGGDGLAPAAGDECVDVEGDACLLERAAERRQILSRARTRFEGIRTPFRVIMQLVGTHR